MPSDDPREEHSQPARQDNLPEELPPPMTMDEAGNTPVFRKEPDEPTEEELEQGANVVCMLPFADKEPSVPSEVDRCEVADVVSLPQRPTHRERSEEQLEKARRRQEVFLQKRRDKKRRKIFYSRVRVLLKLVFTVVLIAGLYALATAGFWYFSAHNINLHGNHLLTADHLVRFMQPFDKKPIYLMNPAAVEQAIREEMTLVHNVLVRRRLFPAGVDVIVTEKPTWGVLYLEPPADKEIPGNLDEDDSLSPIERQVSRLLSSPMYLLHWDNTMTDLAAYSLQAQEIESLGEPIPIVSTRTQLKPQALQRYREIAQYLNSQPEQARLLYLDVSNAFDIAAQFDGFEVRLGRADSAVMNRLNRLFTLIPAIRENQERIRFVDLRWQHQVLFKKKTPEEIAREEQEKARQKAFDREIQPLVEPEIPRRL